MRHLTTLLGMTFDDVEEIFAHTASLKKKFLRGTRPPLWAGRMLTQIFDKPSLRTRASFEAACVQLGGSGIFMTSKDAGLQGRESLADVARVLSSYSDAIVLRTFSQMLVEDFARHASCPVINGLSDERHPCQALTDYFTIREIFGDDPGSKKVVYLGDGNNVALSLATAAAIQKFPITLCTPAGYQVSREHLDEIAAHYPGAKIECVADPVKAVRNADIVYTDVWASMGQESQAEEKNRIFAPYQVNEALMAKAHRDCRFMHCLPARRGIEVDDATMDNPRSAVFQQAENRLHLAKGLLVWLAEQRKAGRSNGRPAPRKSARTNRRIKK